MVIPGRILKLFQAFVDRVNRNLAHIHRQDKPGLPVFDAHLTAGGNICHDNRRSNAQSLDHAVGIRLGIRQLHQIIRICDVVQDIHPRRHQHHALVHILPPPIREHRPLKRNPRGIQRVCQLYHPRKTLVGGKPRRADQSQYLARFLHGIRVVNRFNVQPVSFANPVGHILGNAYALCNAPVHAGLQPAFDVIRMEGLDILFGLDIVQNIVMHPEDEYITDDLRIRVKVHKPRNRSDLLQPVFVPGLVQHRNIIRLAILQGHLVDVRLNPANDIDRRPVQDVFKLQRLLHSASPLPPAVRRVPCTSPCPCCMHPEHR